MYNILIVDDEVTLCRFLEKIILDLKTYNINLIGIAHNANEALTIVKNNVVHLIITDIVMPGKDGIELMQEILSFQSNIKFIVLSGYTDFYYVQSAYRLGAIDYILKTSVSVEQVKSLILDNISFTQNKPDLSAAYDFQTKSYREKFLLGQNQLSYFFMNNSKNIVHIDTDNLPININDNIVMLYITLFVDRQYIDHVWESDYTSFQLGVTNIINELIDKYGEGFSYAEDFSHYVLVLNDKQPSQKIFTDLLVILKNHFEITISGILSNPGDNLSDIPKLYKQCKNYAQYYFYVGKSILFKASNYEHTPFFMPLNITNKLKELQSFFDSNNLAETTLEHIDKLAVYDAKYSISDIKKLYSQYAYAIETYCQEAAITDKSFNNFFELKDKGDLFEYNQWLKNILFYISDTKQNQTDIIDCIILYIQNHFQENIYLDHIASRFKISKWYFCHLFQQRTGTSFAKYLTNCRIEKAKQMLVNGVHSINFIASECGYSSPEHFSRHFKKTVGCSPSQFKKRDNKKAFD